MPCRRVGKVEGLGLSLFKWLCIMLKFFGHAAVLVVPVRLSSFWGSFVGRKFFFFIPPFPLTYAAFAKHQLQHLQQQCRRAAETSLYLNINIIELFLSHGAGFQSQRLFRQRQAIKRDGISREYSQVAFKLATVIRNTVNRATFWPIWQRFIWHQSSIKRTEGQTDA